MRRIAWLLLMALALGGCGYFFEGGLVVGAPTVQVSRENFSLTPVKDGGGNIVAYKYTYTLVLYPLPGSPRGTVVLLDRDGNSVDSPFTIPEPCPVQAPSCPPVSRNFSKESPTLLAPVLVEKYRAVSLDGQSKEIPLPAPIEVY